MKKTNIYFLLHGILIIAVLVLQMGCKKENGTNDPPPVNQAPSVSSNPVPSNGATNTTTNVTLQWTCTDPENDPLTFSVFFGTTNPPTLVESNTSEFNYEAFGLENDTKYYWKIDASDDHSNTTLGTVWNFTTQSGGGGTGTFIDPRDGQVYEYVEIGSQTWMAENLNYSTDNSWCYGNNSSSCDTYGRLYDWATIMNGESSSNGVPSDVQGICPTGWHVPSDEEWKILEGTVDSHYGVGNPEWDATGYRGYDAGKNLKATNGWNSGGNGTDLYGFKALPGGTLFIDGRFYGLGEFGLWWSSTENSDSSAWGRHTGYNQDGLFRNFNLKTVGYSLRCLKD